MSLLRRFPSAGCWVLPAVLSCCPIPAREATSHHLSGGSVLGKSGQKQRGLLAVDRCPLSLWLWQIYHGESSSVARSPRSIRPDLWPYSTEPFCMSPVRRETLRQA